MPSPEDLGTVPLTLDDLRARVLADAPEPARDPADVARMAQEARRSISSDRVEPRGTELRVRIAGPGVQGNEVPVHLAAKILDTLQGAVTAVGSALKNSTTLKTPKSDDGKRLGIRKATEFSLSPTIGAGSVVFFLEGRPETLKEVPIFDVPKDGLLDVAIVRLLDVLTAAQADAADQISDLATELSNLGSAVASKLSAIAEQAIGNSVELDLGHRAPSGRRSSAVLARRGAEAIIEAVERNRERLVPETFVGVLNTVSDGTDMLRLTPDDAKPLRMSVDPDTGVGLGTMLGRRVSVEVETTIRWNIASGRERRSHKLLSARLLDN